MKKYLSDIGFKRRGTAHKYKNEHEGQYIFRHQKVKQIVSIHLCIRDGYDYTVRLDLKMPRLETRTIVLWYHINTVQELDKLLVSTGFMEGPIHKKEMEFSW